MELDLHLWKMSEQVYPNIREYLLSRYISRRKSYSKGFLFLIGIVIVIVTTVAFFTCNREEEPRSNPDPCLGLLLLLILVIFFFSSLFSKNKDKEKDLIPEPPPPETIDPPFTLAGRDEFFCYHCYKVILTDKIHPINCAVCSTSNTFFQIVDKCTRCKLPLRFFACPHCHETLDFLNEPYNPEEIKRRILG